MKPSCFASYIAAALFLVPANGQLFAQTAATIATKDLSTAEFSAKADAFASSFASQGKFRGVVLVAKDGKPLFRKAYGNANDEWGIANTPTTKFRLASITKQFTAVAILQLVEKQKVKLDDPIKLYYADAPAEWDKVTVHHLLNHTSGIPSYTGQKDFLSKSRTPMTPTEIVKLTQHLPLEFAPGERFKYNNTGYILLGVVIEKVTGESYATYMSKNVFAPLGMQNSGYDVTAEVLKQRAQGHKEDGKHADYLDMNLPYAAGSLYSTADDLVKWDEALYANTLIAKASWEKMTTPGLGGYGYGLTIKEIEGKMAQYHSGGIPGFSTFMVRVPGAHLLTIALANQETPASDEIARGLARMYLGGDIRPKTEKQSMQLPASKLAAYAGQYQLGPNFILRVWHENGKVLTQATGQGQIEIFAAEEDRFFPKVMEAELVFRRGPDGKVTGLTLFQGGKTIEAKRISD